MKIDSTVRKETGHVAVGVLLGDAIMVAVFALIGKLDWTVIFGALLGSAAAIGNFFVMGISLQKAMADPDSAKAMVQKSYTLRMLGMVAVMIIGFVTPCFHKVAVVIPFLMPGATIHAMRLFGLYRPQEKEATE